MPHFQKDANPPVAYEDNGGQPPFLKMILQTTTRESILSTKRNKTSFACLPK